MNARAPRSVRAALCALAACGLLACGRQDSAATGTPAASAPTARVLVVGTDAAYAPFESQNEKGEIVGFDIDIVKRGGAEGRAGGEVRQHAVGRHLQRPDAGRPRPARLVDHDHRRTQADDGLHRPLFRCPPADRRARAGSHRGALRRPEDAQGRRADRHHRRRGDLEACRARPARTSSASKATPLALSELETGGIDAVVADNGVVVNYVKPNGGNKFRTVNDPAFTPEQLRHRGEARATPSCSPSSTRDWRRSRADGTYDRIHAQYLGAPAPAGGSLGACPRPASK